MLKPLPFNEGISFIKKFNVLHKHMTTVITTRERERERNVSIQMLITTFDCETHKTPLYKHNSIPNIFMPVKRYHYAG